MPPPDLPAAARRALDAHALDFTRGCASRYEAGAGLAGGDIGRLTALAARLAGDLAAWSAQLRDLEVSRRTSFQPRRAGELLIESVFDEILAPDAARVLAAALDLAWTQP